jgi:hypothetical protein
MQLGEKIKKNACASYTQIGPNPIFIKALLGTKSALVLNVPKLVKNEILKSDEFG